MGTRSGAMAMAALVGLFGCAKDGAAPRQTRDGAAAGLGEASQAATVSLPVRVVNTAADWLAPLPTVAQGTTNVAGTVTANAAQAGAWTVSAKQSGPWSVTASQGADPWSVSLAGTPTVALQAGTSVAVSGTVNVGSLPAVTVANFPSVQPVSFASMPNISATLAPGSTLAVDSSQAVANAATFAGAPKSAVVTVNAYEARQPFFRELTLFVFSGFPSIANFTLAAPGKRLVIEYVSAQFTVTPGVPVFSMLLQASTPQSAKKAVANLAPVKLGGDNRLDRYAANQNLRLYVDDGDTVAAILTTDVTQQSDATVAIHGYFVDAP